MGEEHGVNTSSKLPIGDFSIVAEEAMVVWLFSCCDDGRDARNREKMIMNRRWSQRKGNKRGTRVKEGRKS